MTKSDGGGVIKALGAITAELRGIRNILSSMWHSRYQDGETDLVSPEVYSDEYISTEECARRLNVTDQTIRNWILQGKKKKDFVKILLRIEFSSGGGHVSSPVSFTLLPNT